MTSVSVLDLGAARMADLERNCVVIGLAVAIGKKKVLVVVMTDGVVEC